MMVTKQVTNFFAGLKQIDRQYLNEKTINDRDTLLNNWIPAIKKHFENELEKIYNPDDYINAYLKIYGNKFQNPMHKEIECTYTIDNKYKKALNSKNPITVQKTIENIKSEYHNVDELYAFLNKIRPLHPIFYMLKKLKNNCIKKYRVEPEILIKHTFHTIRYHKANKPELVSRAVAFTLGIRLSDIYVGSNFNIKNNNITFMLDDTQISRKPLTPRIDVMNALKWLRTKKYETARKIPELYIFKPIESDLLPTLHAFIANHFLNQNKENQRQFLSEQGLPNKNNTQFDIKSKKNLENIIDECVKYDQLFIENIVRETDQNLKKICDIILPLILENKIPEIKRETIRKIASCPNNYAAAFTKYIKQSLRNSMQPKEAIFFHGYSIKKNGI